MNEADPPPVFTAVLHPHRSLGLRGLRLVMVLVALASIVASIPFIVLGFWPVAGFYGLDVAILYVALRASANEAKSYEEVWLSPLALVLRKVPFGGRPREWRFNPVWTTLHRDVHHEFGVQRLAITSRGQTVAIGQFLTPDEKADFGDALGKALAKARRGPVFENPA